MNVERQLQLAFFQFNSEYRAFETVRTVYFLKIKNAATSPAALAGAFGVGFLATLLVKRPRAVSSVRNGRDHVMQRLRKGTRFALKAYGLWTALRGGNAVIDRTI